MTYSQIVSRFKCPHCDVVCATGGSLKSHLAAHGIYLENIWPSAKRIDNCSTIYKCDDCGKLLKNKTGLSRHKYVGHVLPKQILQGTGRNEKQNDMPSSHNPHNKIDRYSMNVKLPGCKPDNDRNTSVDAQTENADGHVKDTSRDKQFSCKFCAKVFSSKKGLGSHMQAHSEGRSFKCDVCLKTFKHYRSLVKHTNFRHSEAKLFLPKQATIKKQRICSICGLVFATELTMRLHKCTHDGVTTYSCNLCHKFFFDEQRLNCHKLSHTRGKHFTCAKCNKSFALEANMKAHVKIEHSTTMQDSENLQCNICQENFDRKARLLVHYSSKHIEGVKKEIRCSVCSKLCHSKSKLEMHMRFHTGERPYKCQYCPTSFTYNACLTSHIKVHIA